MFFSLTPFEYVSSTMTEVPENREMSSPEQFVNRILAIPLISSLLDTTTCYYRMTKARLKPLSGIFHCVEDLTTEVITLTGRYVATPLANRIGGWHNIDSWACQMLDKLESAVPQLKEPTQKIEERVYSKIKGLFDDVCDSDDDSGCIFPDSDESESEAVGEPYDTVCHGKDLLPHNGTDYETGEDEETLRRRGKRRISPRGTEGPPEEEFQPAQRRPEEPRGAA
ncbi:perilipin-3-like isoform X1 [Macrobrachium rosenbergii]|uniref:perilipin-3-like isoform X1 n=2 Tax=Macrobrachium rosenbergii TaxID=79674 RepID=UPI0034D4F0F3